jgi:hypothetical protein
MPTIEEVARDVAGLVGVDNDLLLVGQWVARRWQEVANSCTLRALRRVGELVVPAPYSTGTVVATRSSRTITGTGTAFTQEMVGRHIRVAQNWHEIAQVASATSLLLVTDYSEDTISGASYYIVQRRNRLANDARKLGTFVHMRLRRPLHTVSEMGLNLMIASRFEINSVPAYVAEMAPDTDGTRRVEIYPYPMNTELIHYMYWAKPPTLQFHDYIPGDIDIEALREGVLIDVYRNLANKFAMEGRVNEAGYYRNEARAQETTWKNIHKKRLLQQDEGTDDIEFMLLRNPAHPRHSEDRVIDNAYSQVWYT